MTKKWLEQGRRCCGAEWVTVRERLSCTEGAIMKVRMVLAGTGSTVACLLGEIQLKATPAED